MMIGVAISHVNHAMDAVRAAIIEAERQDGKQSKVKRLESLQTRLYAVLDRLHKEQLKH